MKRGAKYIAMFHINQACAATAEELRNHVVLIFVFVHYYFLDNNPWIFHASNMNSSKPMTSGTYSVALDFARPRPLFKAFISQKLMQIQAWTTSWE